MRSTSRVVDVSINTVTKMLEDAGEACAKFHDETVRNVASKRVRADEIWALTYAKERNVAKAPPAGAGDIWTWTAIDAESKLILSWLVGDRDPAAAHAFVGDLAEWLSNRVQLTADGFGAYVTAVENIFGVGVDFAQLIKHYAEVGGAGRYSPPACIGTTKHAVSGNPDKKHISTSYAERHNLNMRTRRFTRLTNAFTKEAENHAHALAIYFEFYNFVRMHKTLKCSPAMAAGISDRLYGMEDMVALMDAEAEPPATRGPYRRKAPSLVKGAENSN